MLGRRIAYALITLVAVVAFIITESGIALYMSVLLLAMPVASTVGLVIASKRVKYDCKVRDSCMRGGVLGLDMRLGVTPRLFVGHGEVNMRIENTTFSKTERHTFVFYDLSFSSGKYEFRSQDTGRIRMQVEKIRLVDFLGICSYTVRRNLGYEAIVSPVLYENLEFILGTGSSYGSLGETLDLLHRGNDRSETFNVRDYVPGDSMNAVHWKLSSKFDSLKSREYGSTSEYRILLLVDLSRSKHGNTATDEELNCVLDATVSLSDCFRRNGLPHCVGWIDGGAFLTREVRDNESFLRMIYGLMSAKVTPEDARAIFYYKDTEESLSFTKVIFLSTSATYEELQEIRGDVTSIAVGQDIGEVVTDQIRMLAFSPKNLQSALFTATV